ncbi:MATE family efflux transporter [Paracoccus sp. SCSIO 75233]|uniref:MATE family efflux transporter n=1 Tax=Paracoccus sp. SCSIO 75233 TaxID=3017782 RepID=UPI0022F12A14|nr:MATE family efflux transporter [Paracoccus sp. SCSIO 75233]WBU52217.1 MATE family efflux transporter [Paracoccus sp. SCSIO 75233]
MRQGGTVTNRRVLAIALPIVLSNATIPLLGAVDTGVIGQLGEAAPIGAVGIGAVILTSIYWVFGFLRMGTSGLVAQAHGAGDDAEIGAHLIRALSIAGVAGVLLILLYPLLFPLAFRLAPASDEVERLALEYLSIRIWGAPATIALYAITGWMIAMERTRDVLILQVLQNGLNVALDFVFVLGLGWSVGGIATATLIAELSGLALGLWFCRHALRASARQVGIFARQKLLRLVRVNADIMIRSMLLIASMTSFMFLSSGQGDVTLAANQILIQFLQFAAFGLDGFAFAAESLVGQAVGARRPDMLRRSSVLSSAWGVGCAMLLALIFAVFGPAIIDLLTTAPEVREEARRYLPWLVAMPLVSVASYMFDGIFIGATLTGRMRKTMIEAVAVYIPALILLPSAFGNHGLWLALALLNATRALTMARFYREAEAAAGG